MIPPFFMLWYTSLAFLFRYCATLPTQKMVKFSVSEFILYALIGSKDSGFVGYVQIQMYFTRWCGTCARGGGR